MRSINDLFELAKTFYTPMGIEKELLLMSKIQEHSIEEIKSNLHVFYSLLQLLYDSHGDDYIYVDKSNERYLIIFIGWLNEIYSDPLIDHEFIESVIDSLSVNTALEKGDE